MSDPSKTTSKTPDETVSRAQPNPAAESAPAPKRTPGITPEFIVAPAGAELDESGPVLEPQPADRLPRRSRVEVLDRVEAAIARVGRLWLHNDEILARWVEEARGIARELEDALASGEFSEVARAVRRMTEVLAWLDAASTESVRRARRASHGLELRDTAALVRDAAKGQHQLWDDVDIHLPTLGAEHAFCRPAALSQAFGLALQALIHRIGGVGELVIEIEQGALFLLHHFRARPADGVSLQDSGELPKHLAQRLRHLVVEVHGGRIFPRAHGSESAALTIAIPRHEQPDLVADCD